MYNTGLSRVVLASILAASGCSDSSDSTGTTSPGTTAGAPTTVTGGTTSPSSTTQASGNGTTSGPVTGGPVTGGTTTSAGPVTGGTPTSAGPVTGGGDTTTTAGVGGATTTSTVDGAANTTQSTTTGGTPDVLTVQLDQVRQIIRGFGLNATITDGAALPWNQLYTLEGENALGLSIVRIGMTETGGHRAVASGWETVKSLGGRVIGSCWSAPGEWKDNGITTNGGALDPDYYDDWATMIAEYARDNGLYAMSVGNETDFASCSDSKGTCQPPLTVEYESMVYTGKQLMEFVKVAGPIFDSIAPDVKMIAPEASLWIHVWSNLSPTGVGVEGGGYLSSDPHNCECFSNTIDAAAEATCAAHCLAGDNGLSPAGYDYGHWLASDPAAWAAFDIMGVHEYESQVGYKWPADVTGGVRDKEVWQTEMSGVLHWPEQGPSKDIKNGLAVARWIHSALTIGEASAWLYWWYKDYYNGDNEGLALLQNDAANATPAKRYFTMGNFSRYIRPDEFHAVQVAGPSPDKVLVSGYLRDNGEVVIVAINETNAAVDVPIAITGGTAPATMLPYVTSEAANWAEGAAVAVTDGSLPAALPAMSVTTFVGGGT